MPDAEYRDRIDIQEDELYELLTRELPKTSLPLPEDVTSLYESLAQEGVTDVIHMSISSGLRRHVQHGAHDHPGF